MRRSPPKPRRSSGPPGHIRVIGGAWRGRRIPVPDSEGLRPTGDRTRETLFNWLAEYVGGADCLDLFAGTGALGLEALSRGARSACFVEREASVAAALADVIRRFSAQGAELQCVDAWTYLQGEPQAFDIVFVDPPFDGPKYDELCTLLAQGWLRPRGWVYLEMARNHVLPPMPEGLVVHREKTAGQVRFALLRMVK
jgi:16S rRNA (guanine966-N2)-methyltransferase